MVSRLTKTRKHSLALALFVALFFLITSHLAFATTATNAKLLLTNNLSSFKQALTKLTVSASAAGLAAPDTAVLTLSAPLCFATPDDGNTLFSSSDSQAVRDAVATVVPGGTVRIAGICAGVAGDEVVYVPDVMTLRGGYTTTNWHISDPDANPTILDGLGQGRVINASQPLTVEHLIIQNGVV